MPRDRPTALFIVLGGFFICNALIAEFIGIKIFALEASLGLPPFDWNLFGQQGSLSFTAGVLVWPVVFVMTDIINEYFGRRGVPDMQAAFAVIFGQGMWTIAGSVVAFLIGQLIDVSVFHRVRRMTGERLIWLRATGSTLVSQLVDSFVVLYIAFVLGPQQWPLSLFLAVGTVNYLYKFTAAVALTPMIYLARRVLERYLGPELATELKRRAAA
jgi:uncharacterized PurR-regulated membrane protein YhhQ (DUF165 family)